MHLDPAHLAALRAILLKGSFEAAAHHLGVTPPAISQRIRALEEQLGAPVLTRTSPVTATAIGARLARHAEHIALMEADLARDLGRDAPRGPVRIAVNADSLDTWFLPALQGLDLEVELVIDDQAHSVDWLRRGEVSAAVTDTGKAAQGCDVFALDAMEYVATATPSFAARWCPNGVTKEALSTAPMLQFSRKDSLQHDWLAARFGQRLTPPTLVLPTTVGFAEACRLDLAWGLNPELLVRDALTKGTLIALDPMRSHIPLFWQVSRLVAAPLEALTQAVRKAAKSSLLAP